MADISIPGISSKYKTDELIKKLVEVEKIPLKRMEESVSNLKTQQSTWREIQQGLSQLRERARGLFGFQSPFNERTAKSSDSSILTATATREAVEGTYEVEIQKIASADKFLSDSLPLDTEIPAGRYGFKVGNQEVSFQFRGGRLSAFVELLKEKGKDLITAGIVKDTAQTQVLYIESLKPGKENQLVFTEASTELGERLGILRKDSSTSRTIKIDQALLSTSKIVKNPSAIRIEGNILRVGPEGELEIPLTPPLTIIPSMVLEAEVRLRKIAEGPPPPPPPPPGPAIPERGGVTLSDVTVLNSPSKVVLPEWKPPPPPEIIEDFNVLSLRSDGISKPLPPVEESLEFRTIQVPLEAMGNRVESILLKNRNSLRELEIKSIRLHDPSSRGEYRPLRAVSTAQDAEILVNGIPLTRSSNTIDDLIPGVTLSLKKPGEGKIKLSVEPDREKVKDAIIAFVGTYNRQMAQINILTRKDDAVLNEITYLKDEEREKAKEKLGLLQGDVGLMQLKNTFQSILMNPYPTRLGRDLSLLSQIGISTNAQAGGGKGIDVSKLRGYLEINEPVLDSALQKNFQAVKDLFGYDSDGDLVPDSGVGVSMDTFLRPYVQTGGIIAMKLSTLDTQISSTNRRIESYNQYLNRYEQDLKRKYGAMESTLNSLEKSSAAIERFNSGNQNNR